MDFRYILLARADVKTIVEPPISQMPPGLINGLNPSELRNLVAYVMSAGNPNDRNYRGRARKAKK